MAVCTFAIAIDRPARQGEDKKTDFPRITVFGKQAENCERFLSKGKLVGIQGRLQTGSYMKDDIKINTTDVVADRVEFLEWGEPKAEPKEEVQVNYTVTEDPEPQFEAVDEIIPF